MIWGLKTFPDADIDSDHTFLFVHVQPGLKQIRESGRLKRNGVCQSVKNKESDVKEETEQQDNCIEDNFHRDLSTPTMSTDISQVGVGFFPLS